MALSLSEFGFGSGRIVAGFGRATAGRVSQAEIEPHGWLIIAPT